MFSPCFTRILPQHGRGRCCLVVRSRLRNRRASGSKPPCSWGWCRPPAEWTWDCGLVVRSRLRNWRASGSKPPCCWGWCRLTLTRVKLPPADAVLKYPH
ncbi:hypothetical protein AVEN_91422-1 [Araneus ventricosus]|uniref:Uncharacterized protein n=1 Tax=Araneus ventricosus TaxID=182803 RepID=A0A4Y2IJ70_ARAVE|nr:hypothetical protein AVEN_91422-1 [Araneus ventricosus]